MSHLSLSLFGGFNVSLDGERISGFGSDKTRALLSYLAVEVAQPHRRAELAAMLWPDLADKKAAHNLSQTVLRLRRALRAESAPAQSAFLLLTPQDIQFNPRSDYQLDVAQFQELILSCSQHHHAAGKTCSTCMQWRQQAVNLYRGDLLAGFFVDDSIAFEEWRLSLQEKLHVQALEALSELAAYYEQTGDYEQVQTCARRQIDMEPWREDAHAQLMRILALCNQSAAALEQFEAYRRTLAQEVGLAPSPRIVALYEQIRSGQLSGAHEAQAAKPNEGEAIWIPGHGERRQLTALVCGCNDATLHSDPEEIDERLARCAPYCEKILNRFGGYRIRQHGDQCLVYFGYPRHYEDAARRAVHSGLAMVSALRESNVAGDQHRIGIHTGDMLISEQHKPGWRERDLIGDVPALARECQALAGPGRVAMTSATERLVRGWFGYRAMQHTPEVFEVLGENQARNHLDGLAQRERLTSFVGREREMEQLLACRDQACAGHGGAVLLTGDAGIGKSRLIWELKRRTPAAPMQWLESHCSPYFQNTSLYPVTDLLAQFLGFEAEEPPAARVARLCAALTRLGLHHPSAVWSLSLLLGLPTDTPAPETITSAQREQMRQVCVALLQKCATEQPLVLVIEDLHWSDPSTIEWLESSSNVIASIPCLVLLTSRPTFHPRQAPSPRMLTLKLDPLSPAHACEMVHRVAGSAQLEGALCQRIVTQTDGVPLFVEELTKALLDRPADGEAFTLPATLRDSLLARLDHLGTAKEIAQWAATLGREFSYPVLCEVSGIAEGPLQDGLAKLIAAGLLYRQGQASQADYVFSHALVQEAAYASLPRRVRQTYHQQIAETLAAQFPHIAEQRPEVLARHYSQAKLNAQAADYWLLAGERATAQGATQEARAFFDKAIAHIAPDDDARRWKAHSGREAVLHLLGDHIAQTADLLTLQELAERTHNDAQRAEVFLRQAQFASWQDDYPAMLRAAEQAIGAASHAGDLAAELRARTGKVVALTTLGEHAAAQQAVEETIAKTHDKRVDEILRAYTLSDIAFYYVESGDLSRALQLLHTGAAGARKAGDRRKASNMDANLGNTFAHLGMYPQARTTLEEGLALAEVIGDRRLQARHLIALGIVRWRMGDSAEARRIEERVQHDFPSTDDTYGQAVHLAYLGQILAAEGDVAGAVQHLSQARELFVQIEINAERHEVQAVLSRCMLKLGQAEAAVPLAAETWAYLRAHGAGGMDSPAMTYLCLADVFAAPEAAEAAVAAHDVIGAGYAELMCAAAKISDAECRRSYLEHVQENRTLVERWEKITSAPSKAH